MSMVVGSLDVNGNFVEPDSIAKRYDDNFLALYSEAGLTVDGHTYKFKIPTPEHPLTPEDFAYNRRCSFIGMAYGLIEHLKANMSVKGIVSTDASHAVAHSLVVMFGETPYTVTGTITDPARTDVTQNNDGAGHVE